MNIGIIGTGSLGLLFAIKLVEHNHTVFCYNPNSESTQALNQGLQYVNSSESNEIQHNKQSFLVKAGTDPSILSTCDYILLCTKAYEAMNTAFACKNALASHTIILSLMNGIDSAEPWINTFGKTRIIEGITYSGSRRLTKNKVQINGIGNTIIDDNSPHSSLLAKILSECGLPCITTHSISTDIWKKAILNCIINPIAALAVCTNGAIIKNEELFTLANNLIIEIHHVIAALKIPLTIEEIQSTLHSTCNATSTNECSMLTDIKNHRKTEIDFLNGRIIQHAKKFDICVPINETLTMLIKAKQSD